MEHSPKCRLEKQLGESEEVARSSTSPKTYVTLHLEVLVHGLPMNVLTMATLQSQDELAPRGPNLAPPQVKYHLVGLIGTLAQLIVVVD